MKRFLLVLMFILAFLIINTNNVDASGAPFQYDTKQFAAPDAVCDPGNVKGNVSGSVIVIEYTDNSATISGNNRTVYWAPKAGFEVGVVCVKIGGPGGGTLISPDPDAGTWTTSTYDISHMVVYTTPLEVVLNSFEVSCPSGTYVQVDWETGSETGTLGFNLYRQVVDSGNWVRVNNELIEAQAPGGGGASYSYEDTGIVLGEGYMYRLDAVGFDGSTVQLAQVGPVKCEQPTAVGISTVTTEGIQINIDNVLPFVVAFMLIAAAAFLMLGRRN